MSHQEKLDRAWLHGRRIDEEIERFLKTEPYTLVRYEQPKPKGQRISFRLQVLREPEPILSLLIGDFLHNARSALDHLVFALPSIPGTEKRVNKVQFPIFKDSIAFEQYGMDFIGHLPAETVTAIRRLQPFNTEGGANEIERHPLWRLHELNNIDKHRNLVFAAGASSTSMQHHIIESRNLMIDVSWGQLGALEHEEEVYVVDCTETGPNAYMKSKCQAAFDVAFSEKLVASGAPVLSTLVGIYNHITDVVFPPLEPFLKGVSHSDAPHSEGPR